MKLRIGSRKSDLAQIQSRIVASELMKIDPTLEVEFVFKDVGVDRDLSLSLVDAESKGLFTKDLTEELIQGKIDIVVHSWKDLPTRGPEETYVAATLEREDPRDLVFINKASLNQEKITVLSSSPRRKENLGSFLAEYVFPENVLEFIPIRGNLPTRFKKYLLGEGDALVVALAAIHRLLQHGNEETQEVLKRALAASHLVIVPVTLNPPAPAQGALALEVRKDNSAVCALLEKINHPTSFKDVHVERERLVDFGGGCHLALGIYSRSSDLGQLQVERGLTPEGATLSLLHWNAHKKVPEFKASEIFQVSQLKLFDRVMLQIPEPPGERRFFFVSKSIALPAAWVRADDVLWASGLESWKKLRAQGYWVSGCQESLGENFLTIPLKLWAQLKAYKLTHKESPEAKAASWEQLATYSLKPLSVELSDDFLSAQAYSWMSGSQFAHVLGLCPAIKNKWHFCGLGNTYDFITKTLGSAEKVVPVLLGLP